MEAVRIMCQLSEAKIKEIVSYVSSCLPANLDDLNDVDKLMMNNSIRVCVEFGIGVFGNLGIKTAEILDEDWAVLETDSFAFTQYLHPVIETYNKQSRQSEKQAREILEDQRSLIPC